MGCVANTKKYNVPHSTLFDYVRTNTEPTEAVKIKLGPKPVFLAKLEDQRIVQVLIVIYLYVIFARSEHKQFSIVHYSQ
ncbi:hypothetical protein C0J52_02729 [Blattella germanica]|nr:hypothetical protein C0J52_02729 [Blattella germanica]